MATIYRPQYTRPLPPDAEIFERGGRRVARWKDARGRTRTAPIRMMEKSDRPPEARIVLRSGAWVAKYTPPGRLTPVVVPTGCRDEDAARHVLAKLLRRAELVRSEVLTADEARTADHAATPVAEHVVAYLAQLADRGTTPAHRENTRIRLERIIAGCGFRTLRDFDADKLGRWLAERVASRKTPDGAESPGMSLRTRNDYAAAAVAFIRWAMATGRLASNPLARLTRANVKTDPRRRRRAMTEDELRRLLSVARLRPLAEYGRTIAKKSAEHRTGKRGTWERLPLSFDDLDAAAARGRERLAENPDFVAELERRGRARALLYKALLLTGLRRNELATLTVAQVKLDGPSPCVMLDAADEKNRQGSVLPLRADLAAELAEHLGTRLCDAQRAAIREKAPVPEKLEPSQTIFDVPPGLVRVLNRDLAAAGIPKRDERGRTLDVHALRTTFGTLLSRAGVSLRTAQAAMRHSDPALTANVYTDPKLLDVASAVAALPALELLEPAAVALRPTGSGETNAAPLAPPLAPRTGNRWHSGAMSGKRDDAGAAREHRGNPSVAELKTPVFVEQNAPATIADNDRHGRGEDWTVRDSNPRPSRCKRDGGPLSGQGGQALTNADADACTAACTVAGPLGAPLPLETLAAAVLALPPAERAKLFAMVLAAGG